MAGRNTTPKRSASMPLLQQPVGETPGGSPQNESPGHEGTASQSTKPGSSGSYRTSNPPESVKEPNDISVESTASRTSSRQQVGMGYSLRSLLNDPVTAQMFALESDSWTREILSTPPIGDATGIDAPSRQPQSSVYTSVNPSPRMSTTFGPRRIHSNSGSPASRPQAWGRLPGLGHQTSLSTTIPENDVEGFSSFEHSYQGPISGRRTSAPVNTVHASHGRYSHDLGSYASVPGSPAPHLPSWSTPQQSQNPRAFDSRMVSGNESPGIHPTHTNRRYVHTRQITDPFIDDPRMWREPYLDSRMHIGGLPAVTPQPSPQRPVPEVSTPPNLNIRRPSFLPDPNVHVNQTIPPPPLSTVQGRIHHDAETRARLDDRRTARSEWICKEAKRISDLTRAVVKARQKHIQTGSQEDHENLEKLIAELDDATNLDKQQEKRRNLFMPEGLRAMRTGPYNVDSDGTAAGQGDGRLFGYEMAIAERVCAEVKHMANQREQASEKESELDEEEFMKRVLAMLEKGETGNARTFIVARLAVRARQRTTAAASSSSSSSSSMSPA